MKYLTAFAAAATLMVGAATLPANAAQTDWGLQTRNGATYQVDSSAPMGGAHAYTYDRAGLFPQGASAIDLATGYRGQ